MIKGGYIESSIDGITLKDIALNKEIEGLRGIRYVAFEHNKENKTVSIEIELDHIYSDYSSHIVKTVPYIANASLSYWEQEVERAVVLYLAALKGEHDAMGD